MTATNRDKSSRPQLSGRDIAGACLAVCGLLIIIWGGTLESVSVTDPGFMSFAVSSLVIVAAGGCLATALPRAARVTLSVHHRHGSHHVPHELRDNRRNRRLAVHQNLEMR